LYFYESLADRQINFEQLWSGQVPVFVAHTWRHHRSAASPTGNAAASAAAVSASAKHNRMNDCPAGIVLAVGHNPTLLDMAIVEFQDRCLKPPGSLPWNFLEPECSAISAG
jgi:hypothetical protein